MNDVTIFAVDDELGVVRVRTIPAEERANTYLLSQRHPEFGAIKSVPKDHPLLSFERERALRKYIGAQRHRMQGTLYSAIACRRRIATAERLLATDDNMLPEDEQGLRDELAGIRPANPPEPETLAPLPPPINDLERLKSMAYLRLGCLEDYGTKLLNEWPETVEFYWWLICTIDTEIVAWAVRHDRPTITKLANGEA